ncbi:SURF1 family protein [Microbacterium amylolyticum]|uniref:SURF1-like protein n=1 Tax=Microbacterium amylolyticum TaxID=936337 RepID=A0ABS4ZLT4_9MICO|nr:SURF1 family cytochrome oxidase biogenesis protein [Microbacterium amylolyticum]MBP2437416.1 cytochrome oxidase assembly protein ShyY1 [Microbacterium amylolyticum]
MTLGPEISSVQEFPPTLREVMLRPRWLGMLTICLMVAAIFAWLLQWQLSRVVNTDPMPEGATEQVLPIDDVLVPGDYIQGPYIGQRVDVSGAWDAEDFVVITHRYNEGDDGFWVAGRLETDDGASLAVAVGFAESREQADAAAEALSREVSHETVQVTGRLIADEGPQQPRGDDPFEITRMSPAQLFAVWNDPSGPVYRAYLTSEDPVAGIADAGLAEISSPAPESESPINWLNLFYALEWAIFGAFSFYLWYRLAKDAWEREVEEFHGIDPDAVIDDE